MQHWIVKGAQFQSCKEGEFLKVHVLRLGVSICFETRRSSTKFLQRTYEPKWSVSVHFTESVLPSFLWHVERQVYSVSKCREVVIRAIVFLVFGGSQD